MDLFNKCGTKYVGIVGIKCRCRDSGLSKKRKCKNKFSKLRRAYFKILTLKEINNYTHVKRN